MSRSNASWWRQFFYRESAFAIGQRTAERRRIRMDLLQLESRHVPTNSVAIGSASLVEGDFGQASMVFTVTRSGDLSEPLDVSFTTQNGTAVAGIDYTSTQGNVGFAAGSSSAAIAVPVHGNLVFQGNRQFSVRLTAATRQGATFRDPKTFGLFSYPFAVTMADLNADAKPELIAANVPTVNMSVLVNTTATGAVSASFATQPPIGTGFAPSAVAVGDFNADGKPDLVVGSYGTNTVSVHLNRSGDVGGAVSFNSFSTFATGTNPYSLAVGDLNGDGRPDVAVANRGSRNLSILLNQTTNGASVPTFAPQMTLDVGLSPSSVVVRDLNGDGRPDLICTNLDSNSVSVLLNSTPAGVSSPVFLSQATFATGSGPWALDVADLNGDGRPDVAIGNYRSNTLSVLLNQTNANATVARFAPAQIFTVGEAPASLAIGDVNSDGWPDLAVVNSISNSLSLLTNRTAPGATSLEFSVQNTLLAVAGPRALALGDLNADSTLDLAIASSMSNEVSVLLNRNFAITTAVGTGTIIDDDAPSSLQVSPTSVTAPIQTTFQPPIATALNAAGRPVQGALITFSVPSGPGPSASFPGGLTSAIAVSGAAGSAAPPMLTSNGEAGSFAMNVVVGGISAPTTTVTVTNTASTTTALSVAPQSVALFGRSIKLTASVASQIGMPPGIVTFLLDGQPIGTSTLNQGVASWTLTNLSVGTHTFSASYTGDSSILGSSSTVAAFEVVPPIVATAPLAGGGPHIKVFNGLTKSLVREFMAYDVQFLGGVNVAVGDVTGDGIPDVVSAPISGGGPHVKIFAGPAFQEVAGFMAYDPSFTGGVNMALGNLDDDPALEIITGAGSGGGPHVRSFNVSSSNNVVSQFMNWSVQPMVGFVGSFVPYAASFRGGVKVASGNLDGIGPDEIITAPGPGGGPHVKGFTTSGSLMAEFMAYDPAFRGGVFVASGDCNGDGREEIITGAGTGGAPHARAFEVRNGAVQGLMEYLAFDTEDRSGAAVSFGWYENSVRPRIFIASAKGPRSIFRTLDPRTFLSLDIEPYPGLITGIAVAGCR